VPGRRLALLTAAGLAAGAAAAFFLLPGRAAPATTTPTTAAATTTTPTWLNAHETRIGSTLVVASGLQMEGDRILFTYDLTGIGPRQAVASADPPLEYVAAAAPASFTLVYPGGTSAARALGPGQHAGRFEVPPGVTPEQVQAISIDSYWVPVPAGYSIDWVPAAPGVRARILQVMEQAENYLVIVELESDGILTENLSVAGEGRDWQSSSYSQIGGQRWTLDFRGETLTDPVRLVVRGIAWIEVAGGGPVDLEGVPR
jgi:hypothetical protein